MTALTNLWPFRLFVRPDFVIGGAERPYMRRWWLIPRNRWFNIYLHQIVRDDDDRALHDHPWWNISIPLGGGYDEVQFKFSPRQAFPLPPTVTLRRKPWRPIFRRATHAHRLALIDGQPTWSLFITGRKVRSWGFWCPEGRWVDWRDFTAGDRGEIVGRGCGEGA